MAPRANWKGFLRLSLVTCPIALFPATSESEKISFNQINRNTGNRIRYLKVVTPARKSGPKTLSRATRSIPTATLKSPRTNLKTLRSNPPAPSRSTSSFRAAKSTTCIWSAPITSCRMARSATTLTP
jgi:hypothetical protein